MNAFSLYSRIKKFEQNILNTKKKYFYKLIYKNKFICGENIEFGRNISIIIGNLNSNIKLGSDIQFRENVSFRISNNAKIQIGNSVFFNNFCSLNCMGEILIGDNTLFGENVKIYDHNHLHEKDILIQKQGYSIGSIKIGNNCWIGSNVVILKNVTIGENSVIGAGCVLHKSVDANSIIINRQNLEKYNFKIK